VQTFEIISKSPATHISQIGTKSTLPPQIILCNRPVYHLCAVGYIIIQGYNTNMLLLWQIFVLFTRVALFSWGGGPASLALMQREVTAAGWATPEEFANAVALGNALPGPIAPQVSAYVGYQLAGLPGAIAAVTGTVVPATLLMLVMIVFFFSVKDNQAIKSMLKAVRPVVVGLLLWTAYDMGSTVLGTKNGDWLQALQQGWDKLLFVVVSFALLTFTSINPAFIILGAALIGLIIYR
jgi:chromate transporter